MGVGRWARSRQDDAPTAVPWNGISEVLEASGVDVTRDGDSLSLFSTYGRTRVVSEHFTRSEDASSPGLHVLRIETELPQEVATLDDAQVATFNTMACFGALVPAINGRGPRVLSRITVDLSAPGGWEEVVELVAFAAWLQSDGIVGAMQSVLGLDSVPVRLPDRDVRSAWADEDFEAVADAMGSRGLRAEARPGGLRLEIDLSEEEDAGSARLDVESAIAHRALGNGLFFKLEMPGEWEEERLITELRRLNLREYEDAQGVSFFGAWCRRQEAGRLTFVGFWPNVLHGPGSTERIVSWMVERARETSIVLQSEGRS